MGAGGDQEPAGCLKLHLQQIAEILTRHQSGQFFSFFAWFFFLPWSEVQVVLIIGLLFALLGLKRS